MGAVPVQPVHDPAAVLDRADHGPGVRRAHGLPVDREEVHEGRRTPQPAPASARRAGPHRYRVHGPGVLRRCHDHVHQRHHRVQVRHLDQRDDLDGPYRSRPAPAARLLHRVPVLPGSAAQRPPGTRARHRDGHRPSPADRRVHRDPPAARPGGRARPSDPTGVPGGPGSEAYEPPRQRRQARCRQLVEPGPGRRGRRSRGCPPRGRARAAEHAPRVPGARPRQRRRRSQLPDKSQH